MSTSYNVRSNPVLDISNPPCSFSLAGVSHPRLVVLMLWLQSSGLLVVQDQLCQGRRNPVHHQREPVFQPGDDHQRGWIWNRGGGEDERGLHSLVPHGKELGTELAV